MNLRFKYSLRKWRALRGPLYLAGLSVIAMVISLYPWDGQAEDDNSGGLDRTLTQLLRDAGFTGKVESTLEARLGRRTDPTMAELGRLLFFDKILGLHNDNSCGGCHSPAFGFGDRSRWRSASTTTTSSAQIDVGRATSAGHRSSPTRSFTRL